LRIASRRFEARGEARGVDHGQPLAKERIDHIGEDCARGQAVVDRLRHVNSKCAGKLAFDRSHRQKSVWRIIVFLVEQALFGPLVDDVLPPVRFVAAPEHRIAILVGERAAMGYAWHEIDDLSRKPRRQKPALGLVEQA
jgi:hypothetical protein